jgi:hypothetical protein
MPRLLDSSTGTSNIGSCVVVILEAAAAVAGGEAASWLCESFIVLLWRVQGARVRAAIHKRKQRSHGLSSASKEGNNG